MAADPATLSAIAGLLKEDYLPVIREQFSYKRVLDSLLETNTEDVAGLEAVMAVRVSGNVGVGFRGDNDALPAAGRQNVQQVKVPMRYLYGRCGFTGPAIAASRKNATAFAKVMQDEMESLTKDLRRLANAYNFGDGSGALAIVASSPDANTLVVDRWSNLFTPGRVLDSYTAKTGGSQGMNSKAIASIDKDNLTITVTGHGASANDYIFLEDSRGDCQMGLMGIIDNGTFLSTHQSLARASYDVWNSKVLENDGTARNISESLLMDGISLIDEEFEEGTIDLLLGTIFQRNDLVKELQAQRQFTFVNTDSGKDLKLRGGIKAVEIAGVPFTWDRDVPAGYCFGLHRSSLSFFSSGPLDWMDKDGSVLARVEGYDRYEAVLMQYRELGAEQVNCHFRMEDLNENRPAA